LTQPTGEEAETPGLKPHLLKPAVDEPLHVHGQYQMTSRSQVSSEELVLLHFILESLELEGTPARLLHTYMQAFVPQQSLTWEEVKFNLGDEEQLVRHQKAMAKLAQRLSRTTSRRVVIFITNHSHDVSGSLYVSPSSCASVFDVSYTPWLKALSNHFTVHGCSAATRNRSMASRKGSRDVDDVMRTPCIEWG
jgi:hypothetical protein